MTTMSTIQLRAALLRAIDYSHALDVLARAGVELRPELDDQNMRIRALSAELQRRRAFDP